MLTSATIKLAVIGLGYVGLPLAVEFGRKRSVVGFDINQPCIDALKAGHDSTLEVSNQELAEASQLSYTANINDLTDCNVFIVTVPTPINEHKQPEYRDFRAGDVRHSQADVSKAKTLLGYEPSPRIGQGIDEAMPWYKGFLGQTK